MHSDSLSRRKLVFGFGGVGALALLAACAAPAPTATPVPAKPSAPAAAPATAPTNTPAPAAAAATKPAAAATAAPAAAAATKPAEPTKPAAAPAATTAPAAAAKPAAGTITVYSALNESTNKSFVEAFEKAVAGVKVEVLPLAAAGELQTRIRTEKAAPRADVFIGGSSEFHDPLAKEGLLETYKSPRAEAVGAEFKDPEGRWTGWYLGIFGMVLNKDRWAKEMAGKPNPTTWDDLLDPALKGKIAFPDPVKTGGGYIFMANQYFRLGKDELKTLDYMKKLNDNIGQYAGTSPLGIELVSQGQFMIGPNWGHDILTAANRGAPIEFVAPVDTAFEIGAVSIVKGGPNLAGAKAFVDWVLTKEASELNVKLSNRLSVLKDVPPAPGAPTLDKVKLVNYDRAWATDNKDRLLKAWSSAVGR
jgi:iron(III) transport system substrate-binding protein